MRRNRSVCSPATATRSRAGPSFRISTPTVGRRGSPADRSLATGRATSTCASRRRCSVWRGPALANARAVVVTEGPFDWLTACSWGLHAVALLGTHASRDALCALRSFRRVYLALDADGAGRRATAQLASALGARAVVVPLPEGVHDLNELGCRRGGRDAFLRSLYEARARMEESWPKSTERDHSARAA